ncbi:MAG: hypothetical protein JOY54_18380 [Acidobacteriaceae bacterium]|nr:hypothetical protein [Acidobacteriaceae bacterium]
MPLNENLSWAEVGAISTGSNSVADAFKSKSAERVLLTLGTKLYKFNDFNSPTAPGSKALSPWWSPYDDYRHDGGWEQRKKLAKLLGVSIRELGRVTSAVKENWNSLQYLLVITLSQAVYAFFGDFAQMPRQDAGAGSKRVVTAQAAGGAFVAEGRGATKNLPGGGTQFYIPNLTLGQVGDWRVESLLGS